MLLVLLLNAGCNASNNDQHAAVNPVNAFNAVQGAGAFASFKGWMKSFFLSENQRIVSNYPPEYHAAVYEYLSMSFVEAEKIASKYGLPIDWAYQFHDPFKDNCWIVKKWMKVRDPVARQEMKEKIILNPTLKNIFAWKGEEGVELTNDNLTESYREGRLDIFKYQCAIGYRPLRIDFYVLIQLGHLEIVEHMINKMGFEPDLYSLFRAMYNREGTVDMFKFLVKKGNLKPTMEHFDHAFKRGRLDIVMYLIEEWEFIPNQAHLKDAIENNWRDIAKYLVDVWKLIPTGYDRLKKHALLENYSDSLILSFKSGLSQDQRKYLDSKEVDLDALKCQICMKNQIDCYFSCRLANHAACQACFNTIKETDSRCPSCSTKRNEEVV